MSEELVNVYTSTVPNCRYVFKDGTVAVFSGREYATSVPSEIEQLDAEVRGRHPQISRDETRIQVSRDLLDPLYDFKQRIIQEYLAKQAAAGGNPNRDMGTSARTPLIPANTRAVAPVAAGGSGVTTFDVPSALAKALQLSPEVAAPPSPETELQQEVDAAAAALAVFQQADQK